MWDYLRRSRTQGYFVPLSGGIDSCATAVIVFSMCRLVAEAAERGGKVPFQFSFRLIGYIPFFFLQTSKSSPMPVAL